MIRKIILIILLFFTIVSCGKKGDLKYKETELEFMSRCMSDINLISKIPSEEKRSIECTSQYKNYD